MPLYMLYKMKIKFKLKTNYNLRELLNDNYYKWNYPTGMVGDFVRTGFDPIKLTASGGFTSSFPAPLIAD